MRRKLLTLAAGASAVVCIAVCGLWVRSYYNGDAFSGFTRAASYSCDVGRGRVWVARDTRWGRPEGWSFTHATTHPPHLIATPTGTLGRLGFFLDSPPGRRGEPRISLVFPIWFAAAIAAILPACVTPGRLRRWRRRARGACLNCGYDLRATPDRCPECGVVRKTGAA
jgi:hypothetical protein